MLHFPIFIVFVGSFSFNTAILTDKNFKDCQEFFADRRPPQHFDFLLSANLEYICQERKQARFTFATLFDTNLKIPVYSAYKYTASIGPSARENQFQIDIDIKKKEKDTGKVLQGKTEDYNESSDYNRGHLAPNSYFDSSEQASTFQMTNIVPQAKRLNNGKWNELETSSREEMEERCRPGASYFITGAIFGLSPPPLAGKINIPSFLYTAACCLRAKKDGRKFSFAYLVENRNNPQVEKLSVLELGIKVRRKYPQQGGTHIQFFEDDCGE